MRNSRLFLILSGLALLAMILLLSLPHKSNTPNPPVSIQIVEVSTNTEVLFHVLFTAHTASTIEKFQLQETNYSIIPKTSNIFTRYDSKTKSVIYVMRFIEPLSADKPYRLVARYYYRGAFEQKVCSWAEHVPVLNRFVLSLRKGLATSEWFVVKPEASQSNTEHYAK